MHPLPEARIIGLEPIIVHVNHRGDWVFLLVHTDTGITGLGEASHSGNDALLLATLEVFSQQLVGQSPFRIEAMRQRLARLDGGRISHTALSAIEQALWDILGQSLGVPLHVLFGGAVRDRVWLLAHLRCSRLGTPSQSGDRGPASTGQSAFS